MVPILRQILAVCFPPTNEHEMVRSRCFENMFQMYNEMNHWIPDGTSTGRFATFAQRHLLLYVELNLEVNPTNEGPFWRLYPKHHLLAHVNADDNPKSSWLYRMESEIGLAVKVAAGVNVANMHRAFIQRYHATHR